MTEIETDTVAKEFSRMCADLDFARKALVSIREILPEDSHDWQLHGVHASDRYVRIEQIITLALATKQLPI